MNYVLVNIGCIECGVSSAVVGIFDAENDATRHAERLNKTHSWRDGGQNSFEVFKLPCIINACSEGYREGDKP